MKKVILISHCALNPFCELPEAPIQLRRSILKRFMGEEWGIVQLPCPELCYQALERDSIEPGDEKAAAYEDYCRNLLQPIFQNLDEYGKHNIAVGGIIGIDTSPSCSAQQPDAIMMKVLKDKLKEQGEGDVFLIDMPVSGEEEAGKEFLNALDQYLQSM